MVAPTDTNYTPEVPPQTASSEPVRPSTVPRLKTGTRRRPQTARPDTSASGIGDLPDQEFFPEGDDIDEEWDGEEEDEVQDGEVFAFARPTTRAVPNQAFSDTTGSVPPTRGGMPTTAGTFTTDYTAQSGGTFGSPVFNNQRRPSVVSTNSMEPTGQLDAGGHLPELIYDAHNPAPFSGRKNPNNSAFAFHPPPRTGETAMTSTSGGKSFLSRFRRQNPQTASTAYATTTEMTESRGSFESGTGSEAGSFRTGTTGTDRRAYNPRTRSKQPLIENSIAGDSVAQTATSRGISRGSYGLTEMTGDMTVPDGKTTWGDGMGGMIKEDGESIQDIELDDQDDDSPYPEVRASVSNIDDPEMPCMTFRSYTLGLVIAVAVGSANTFFFLRNPSPYIGPLVVQIIAFPLGKFAALILPIRQWRVPKWLGGWTFSFNPGPFNIKEHALITIMANVAVPQPFALSGIIASEKYYGRDLGFGFSVLFTLSSQLTGFAFAGLFRRFVVEPASMIWPGNLVVATQLNTLHAEMDAFQGGMSRYKFLFIAMGGAFVYFFLPGFLFTALSQFTWACWIAPRHRVVNILFGTSYGLGMGLFTFDWTQISYIGSPLVTPWWASANLGIGFLLFCWIIIPAIYFKNVWQTAYLPVNVNEAGDRFGSPYNVTQILTAEYTLNETAYMEYSPIYLSATTIVLYITSFALATALIVHTALHHGPRIYRTIAGMQAEPEDIHLKLMKRYPSVPTWWYLAFLAFNFAMAVVAIEVWHTGLPIWGYLVAILLPAVYLLPAAFVLAMTNQLVSINLIAELIPGYALPGRALPGMVAKIYSVQTLVSGVNFLQDLKLGHYLKLAPRQVFIAQTSVALITSLVQVSVKHAIFSSVPDVCTPDQKDNLTCAQSQTFYTASIVWGLIGPKRLFSMGAIYHPQTYAILAGAITPIPIWLWVRRYPQSRMRNLSLPVILTGMAWMPPATGVNYVSFLIVAFIFNFWIRRRRFAWWSKYNYVLSSGLDTGTALSAVIIFLTLGLTRAQLNWWGNDVWRKTWDYNGVTYLDTPPEGFGPTTWT